MVYSLRSAPPTTPAKATPVVTPIDERTPTARSASRASTAEATARVGWWEKKAAAAAAVAAGIGRLNAAMRVVPLSSARNLLSAPP